MKCYNKKCLYNIRADDECGVKEDSYKKIYINIDGKCGYCQEE